MEIRWIEKRKKNGGRGRDVTFHVWRLEQTLHATNLVVSVGRAVQGHVIDIEFG
jgi:hypothetical protein